MSRYIDADALESQLFRDGIAGIFLNYPRRTKFTIGEIRGMLKNERIAPTADVVEVVRCKDCKHLTVVNNESVYARCEKTGYIFWSFETDTREHFCAYGERSENGK